MVSGGSASWSIYAYDGLGTTKFNYAWFHDGVPVIGATNAVFTLSQVTSHDAGNYWCVVGNAEGTTQSEPTILVVNPPPAPVILTQPLRQVPHVGEVSVLLVGVYSPSPCTYQWQLYNQNIPDETNATLCFPEVQLTNMGIYRVLVRNENGSTASDGAAIKVLASPKIQIQPRSVITSDELTVHFWVKSLGEPPFFYQWRLNGVEIAGATNDVLWLTNAQPAFNGNYSVAVSNSAGTVLSDEAPLIVRTGPQIMNFERTGDSVLLTIKTTPGKSYMIEESPDTRTWSSVLDFISESRFEEQAVPRTPNMDQVYFRVRIE